VIVCCVFAFFFSGVRSCGLCGEVFFWRFGRWFSVCCLGADGVFGCGLGSVWSRLSALSMLL